MAGGNRGTLLVREFARVRQADRLSGSVPNLRSRAAYRGFAAFLASACHRRECSTDGPSRERATAAILDQKPSRKQDEPKGFRTIPWPRPSSSDRSCRRTHTPVRFVLSCSVPAPSFYRTANNALPDPSRPPTKLQLNRSQERWFQCGVASA